jgi:hypothetical protein
MNTIENGKPVEVRYFGVTERIYSLIREKCSLELPPFDSLSTESELRKQFKVRRQEPKPAKDSSKVEIASNVYGKASNNVRAEGRFFEDHCAHCGKELGLMSVKSAGSGNHYCTMFCMGVVEPNQRPSDPRLELEPLDELERSRCL